MYGYVARRGGREREDGNDVLKPNYWKKIKDDVEERVKIADVVADFYKDVVHNTHCQLIKQEAEIKRLKKLLETRVPLQLQEEEKEDSGRNVACPVGQGKDPFAIFPAEIWQMVLDQVNHPDDFYSCFNSCNDLKEMLEPDMTQWLFPKIFPLIYHHLEKRDILNCRAICKSWMTVVDHRIERNIESATDDPSSYNAIQNFFKNYYQGCSPPFALFNFPFPVENHMFDPQEFPLLELDTEMKLHPRNPFLGRAVSCLELYTESAFINEVLEFFKRCGQHMFYLMIRSSHVRVARAGNFLQLVNQCLVMTPKLKTLNLVLHCLEEPREVIPKLCCPPSLETLIIKNLPGYCRDNIDVNIFADLLVSPLSQQLVRLESIFWSDRFIAFQWPNLQELKLRCVTSEEALLGLLTISLPALKSLQITFSSNGRQERIPLVYHHLLRIANHFPELSSLELGNLRDVLYRIQDMHNVPLPKDLYASSKLTTLKVLKGTIQHPHWNSFLLRFPYLKYLYFHNDGRWSPESYWTWYPTRVPSNSTNPKQYNYGREIFNAPIWKMFPRLQVLVYRYGDNHEYNCAYTREGHLIRPVSVDPSDIQFDSDYEFQIYNDDSIDNDSTGSTSS